MMIYEPSTPWEVHTPRGKADVLLIIDYSSESYVYFLTAQRGTGEFWVYRNDKCQLFWNESTGLGKREAASPEPDVARGTPETWGPGSYNGHTRIDALGAVWVWEQSQGVIPPKWRRMYAKP